MKLSICFIDGGLPFEGSDILEQELGGSETACYYMARELAKLGHDVHVVNSCKSMGLYHGVKYHNVSLLQHITLAYNWDIIIVNRIVSLLGRPMQANMFVLWNHDMPQENIDNYVRFMYNVDKTFFMSDFQFRKYRQENTGLPVGWIDPIAHVTRNGIDYDAIQKITKNVKRVKNRVVYISRPERGLERLVQDIWPALTEQFPHIELHMCSYSIDANMPDQLKDIYKLIEQKLKMFPNIINYPPLSKTQLYELLASARAMIYPCHFPEISCIAVMESMACGTPVITTKAFALPETIQDGGVLISGRPRLKSYRDEFVRETSRLMTDDLHWKQISNAARARASQLTWSDVAKEWNFLFQEFFKLRLEHNKKKVFQRLVHDSDLVVAQQLAREFPEELSEELTFVNTLLQNQEDPEFFERYTEPAAVEKSLEHWEHIARFKEMVLQIPKEAETLLDIGCNTGISFAHIQKLHSKIQCVGIDSSATIIAEAREFISCACPRPEDIKLINTSVHDFQGGPFDVVIMNETLEHIVDTVSMVNHLERLCKIGGKIILTLPSGPWESDIFWEERRSFVRDHCHHFTYRDLEQLLGAKKEFNIDFFMSKVTNREELVGNFVVHWINDRKGVRKLDHWPKIATMRPYKKVVGAMIVKNEEDWIGGCIKSILPIIDQLIIYDTGSTDTTKQIVEHIMRGRRTPKLTWVDGEPLTRETGGFAAARNRSFSYADKDADWFLWWDADERLHNGSRIHQFLHSTLFNAFIIQQAHLMLDLNSAPDNPARLFKANKGIQFYGYIHEHPEQELNKPIEPILVIPSVVFAHYGYTTEMMRREKCVLRNLPFLLQDRVSNPNRITNLILIMRDYVHCAEWHMQKHQGNVTEDSIKFLRQVVEIHANEFLEKEYDSYYRRWWQHAHAFYQKALSYLGKANVSALESVEYNIPFQVASCLAGGIGGLESTNTELMQNLDRRWFYTPSEFERWANSENEKLSKVLAPRLFGEPTIEQEDERYPWQDNEIVELA